MASGYWIPKEPIKKTKRYHAYWCVQIVNSFFVYDTMKSVFRYSWRIKLLLCVRTIFAGTSDVYLHCTTKIKYFLFDVLCMLCIWSIRDKNCLFFISKLCYSFFSSRFYAWNARTKTFRNVTEMKWLYFHIPVVPNIHLIGMNIQNVGGEFRIPFALLVSVSDVSVFSIGFGFS